MNSLSPMSAAIGGALIGLGAGILWIVYGRLANISGLLGNFLSVRWGERLWSLAFIAGVPIGSAIGLRFGPALVRDMPTDPIDLDGGAVMFAIAGLLVGVGGAMARNSSSDPGMFGMALLSPRSIVAAIVASTLALLTVFAQRHVL